MRDSSLRKPAQDRSPVRTSEMNSMADEVLVQRLHDVIAQLLRTYKIVDAAQTDGQPMALNPADGETLSFLGQKKGAILRDVAEHLSVPPTTATSVVDRLEQKGLVRRQAKAGDRRQVEVALTAAGEELHARLIAQRVSACRAMLARLPPDEQRTLIDLMNKVAGRSI